MSIHYVITADLGLLRAYRLVQDEADSRAHLELVEEFIPPVAHQKISDQVSDGAGRFPGGGGARAVAGDPSGGERHNRDLEQARRLLKLLAGRISHLLGETAVERCWLAASPAIHLQLLEALTAPVRAKIRHSLPRDLTKVPPARLLEHLPPASP